MLLCAAFVVQADDGKAPRTGFLEVVMTPVEVLGEAGAQSVADIVAPEEKISWQLYVPGDYSAEAPPGVVVYVSPRTSGGPPRDWNDLLNRQNLIWIGANGAGNNTPVAERMLTAMMAPIVLSKSYVFNPERCYVAGLSGGGMTATRTAAAKPELFKGGIYMAGTVSWGDKIPPKIDLIKQNYHVFMVGTYDPALQDTQRVYKDYVDAGVENSTLIMIRNYRHKMPPSEYFVKALTYLDSRISGRDVSPPGSSNE